MDECHASSPQTLCPGENWYFSKSPLVLSNYLLTRRGPDFHLDTLMLVKALHLLTLCRLAVRLAHRRCPPPLSAGKGGAPRTYQEESLLLIALLQVLWRLSYADI